MCLRKTLTLRREEVEETEKCRVSPLYSLPNISRVIKWRRMELARHVARVNECDGAYGFYVGHRRRLRVASGATAPGPALDGAPRFRPKVVLMSLSSIPIEIPILWLRAVMVDPRPRVLLTPPLMWGNLRRRNHLDYFVVDGRITLKRTCRK
jgi:hypothetical protein